MASASCSFAMLSGLRSPFGAQGGFVLGDEHPDALEFLQRGNGFVVQARRNQHGFLGGLGLFGGLPHGLEGFVPGGRLQFAVAADHRLQDALARFGPGFVTTAHAQMSLADRRIEIAEDLDDAVFLRINQQAAADGAFGARGANGLAGAELAAERGGLVEQRPGGARRDARAAARAGSPTCRTSRRGPRRRGFSRRDWKCRACGCLPFPRRCARNGCTGCSGCGRGRGICPTRPPARRDTDRGS